MMEYLIRHFVRDSQRVEDPGVRQRYGVFAGSVGILLNLLLFAGKLTAGWLTGAISVTADAFNNLSDAASSVVTLVGFRLAGQKPDADHPFGHGRMEYLAGLFVSVLILLVGLELGKSSIEKILSPEAVELSLLSAAILVVSIGVKLWMAFFNRFLSRRIHSAAMAATATDSLTDAVATGAVLLGLLAGALFQVRIDGWVGLLVAVFILKSGLGAAKSTLDPLLGQPPEPELVHQIEQLILSHRQIMGIHDLVIHDYGPGRRMMSVHAEVPADADIMEAHDVIDHIERDLYEQFGLEAVLHMDPIARGDARTEALYEEVRSLIRQIDPSLAIHDFRVTAGPLHTNLIFDVVAPYHLKLSDAELSGQLARRVHECHPDCYAVVHVDHDYVTER